MGPCGAPIGEGVQARDKDVGPDRAHKSPLRDHIGLYGTKWAPNGEGVQARDKDVGPDRAHTSALRDHISLYGTMSGSHKPRRILLGPHGPNTGPYVPSCAHKGPVLIHSPLT